MCLSAVYTTETDGQRNLVCESVSEVDVRGDTVVLTDILGRDVTVRGVITKIDLIRNNILIEKPA
ncbi:MAG: CooT family nickel-binding protein [Gracilibacteraceae bacterium]|jgi:predicted RNA-binding protein|nr:CooT family nickel-binding protein [Gracilibacteraceae bacterium]